MSDNVIMQELQTEDAGTGIHVVLINGNYAGWFQPDACGKSFHCYRGSDSMHLGVWSSKFEATDQIHGSFRD